MKFEGDEPATRQPTLTARYGLPWLLATGLLLAPQAAADGQPDLKLSISSPTNGAVIGDPGGMAFVSGKALALFGEFQTFDIVFVIDTSESTSEPSGADIDGDGVIGERRGKKYLSIIGEFLPLPNSDKGDSILAAEIAAVKTLLNQLDPRTTRVGIVAFAGDNAPLTPDAYTVVPLTTEYEDVKKGLDDILDSGPSGLTNMVTAVKLATVELMGTQTAYSEKREGSRRIIMFLTDGTPTLPIENSRMQNARMTIQQAVKAAKLNIRIDTFAIGADALDEPVVVVEMARVSSGVFTPVLQPADLHAVFEDVNFAEIQELDIKNKTSGKPAEYTIRNPDGSFSALLPMQEGKNTLEVYARATNESEARRQVTVTFLPNAAVQTLPPRLVAQRNRLMENRLLDLQRRRLQIQTVRDEEVRRQLEIEIEEQRARAMEASEKMRRQIEVEVEE